MKSLKKKKKIKIDAAEAEISLYHIIFISCILLPVQNPVPALPTKQLSH